MQKLKFFLCRDFTSDYKIKFKIFTCSLRLKRTGNPGLVKSTYSGETNHIVGWRVTQPLKANAVQNSDLTHRIGKFEVVAQRPFFAVGWGYETRTSKATEG
jgi:hypothetical protein